MRPCSPLVRSAGAAHLWSKRKMHAFAHDASLASFQVQPPQPRGGPPVAEKFAWHSRAHSSHVAVEPFCAQLSAGGCPCARHPATLSVREKTAHWTMI